MPNWVTVRVKAQNPEILKEKFTREFTKKELQDEEYISESGNELERIVDFNALIPKPKDLEIVAGGIQYEVRDDRFTIFPSTQKKLDFQETVLNKELAKHYNGRISQKKFVENCLKKLEPSLIKRIEEVYDIQDWKAHGEDEPPLENILKGYFNVRRYGHANWYSWSLDKWGTKWNAHTMFTDIENGFVEFTTAWSCPIEVLQELSKHTPIAVAYCDEDTGVNYGIFTMKDGIENVIVTDTKYFGDLTGVEKLQAIITAECINGKDEVDLEDGFYYYTDEEEFKEHYGMSKEDSLPVTQEQCREISKILHTLELV